MPELKLLLAALVGAGIVWLTLHLYGPGREYRELQQAAAQQRETMSIQTTALIGALTERKMEEEAPEKKGKNYGNAKRHYKEKN